MGTDIESIPLDMKQLFFNNLKLLGFDAPALEAAHRIPFNKSMFDLPNRHGAEIVLHFLFQRLNPTMCKEYFRDSWPVLDKKREQAFRKTCYTWLTSIAQEEQESRLPRINASLFMSPGGDKFVQLLFYFSGFVREKVMETELGSKASDRLRYPSLTSQNLQLGEVILKDLTCSSVRHRKAFFSTAQLTVKANKTWKDTVDEYVREYRKLSKDVRELDYKIRAEEQRALEASVARCSPVKRHGQPDHLDPDFDPGTIKRAQGVQQVREMWKQLEEFDRTESAEREVVESIVERTVNKHRLDAADISIKVPDMLLRECGEEIRRRNVDNTYQGGKLNLVSVLQLWNLCLHLYQEKIQEVGVAKFDEDLQLLKSQLHVQQSYRQNAVSLRQQMAESIPALKSSIQKLREKLDNVLFQDQSPESIRRTSVGLGLVEPSPEPNFSPGSAVTPAGGVGVSRSPHHVETPLAADRIAEDVRAAVRKGPDEMFSDLNLKLLEQETRQDKSSLPRPSKSGSQLSSKQSSRPTSARSQGSQKPSRPTSARSTSSRGSKGPGTPRKTTVQQQAYQSFSSPREGLRLEQSFDNKENYRNNALQTDANLSASSGTLSARSDGDRTLSARSDGDRTLSARSDGDRTLSAGSDGSRSGSNKSTPRSGGSKGSRGLVVDERGEMYRETDDKTKVPGRKTPTDLLVEEIMGEGKILSPFASGMEAFETHTLLRRSPDEEEEGEKDEDRMTGYPYDADQIEEILGPELEEEYDNANLSGTSHRSSELLIVINRSLQQSPRASNLPQSPRGSSLQQSPRGWTLHPSLSDQPLGKSPLVMQMEQSQSQGMSDIRGSPEGSDPHESPREARQDRFFQESSPQESPRESPEPGSPTEFTPPDSPHGAIIIDRSFQYTPRQTEFGQQARSQTPVRLPSQEMKPMSPAARLSQSLMNPLPSEHSPVTKEMLAQLLSPESLSKEIRQMYKKAISDTPTHNRKQFSDITATATGGDDGEGLELPNMDPNSRCLSDLETNTRLKPQDVSWDLTDNLEDIQMPDFGLDNDIEAEIPDFGLDNDDEAEMPDFGLDNDLEVETGDIDEDKDRDTEKLQDGSLLDINSKDLEEFFSEKTPDLPKRTFGKTSGLVEQSFEEIAAMQGSPEGLDRDDEAKYSLENEKLICFTP